jgi:hypothetical protein
MRDEIFQDLRYGFRAAKANPSFTMVAVLALALGIGAATAIFSVVDRVMLRPLPYPEADRLVSLGNLPHPEYFDWRARNDVFEEMAVVTGGGPRTLTGLGEATQMLCGTAAASFFKTFRVQPMLGRAFTEAEDKTGAAEGDGADLFVLAEPLRRSARHPGQIADAQRRAVHGYRRDAAVVPLSGVDCGGGHAAGVRYVHQGDLFLPGRGAVKSRRLPGTGYGGAARIFRQQPDE